MEPSGIWSELICTCADRAEGVASLKVQVNLTIRLRGSKANRTRSKALWFADG